jgi:uncharacterized iron-regulated protein
MAGVPRPPDVGAHSRAAVAANLSRERARAIIHHEVDPTGGALGELPSLPPPALEALEHDLRASHCGMLPESMVPALALAQRARDWTMAGQLRRADHGPGAVLCAGDEHVRRDRGVAFVLRALGASDVLSVAFVEVRRGEFDPDDYLEVTGPVAPFDFVGFTPRVDEKDPCAEMRSGGAAPPMAPN